MGFMDQQIGHLIEARHGIRLFFINTRGIPP